ncbi:hypothetical protein [Sphingomonas sp.]|uniref:hypothetical protein n=1 Tax=Sphingomonas sp. TaxID=28214 RepID=UPI003D6DA40B
MNAVIRMLVAGVIAVQPVPVPAQSPTPAGRPAGQAMPMLRDGARDFDFEFGAWTAHISRRLRPLTGSSEWVEYDGLSTVRKVWDGNANLGELNVSGPGGKIQGLSLRLYDPASRQWKISWANARDGAITPAMIGGFDASGHGEFYNQDALGDRQIFVRFIFSPVVDKSFRIEQSFSGDGGKTWEVNWISDFRRAD